MMRYVRITADSSYCTVSKILSPSVTLSAIAPFARSVTVLPGFLFRKLLFSRRTPLQALALVGLVISV